MNIIAYLGIGFILIITSLFITYGLGFITNGFEVNDNLLLAAWLFSSIFLGIAVTVILKLCYIV